MREQSTEMPRWLKQILVAASALWALPGFPIALAYACVTLMLVIEGDVDEVGYAIALLTLVILTLGVSHLTLFYTHDLRQSLAVGYFPFVAGDLLKILAATSIYRSYKALRS